MTERSRRTFESDDTESKVSLDEADAGKLFAISIFARREKSVAKQKKKKKEGKNRSEKQESRV